MVGKLLPFKTDVCVEWQGSVTTEVSTLSTRVEKLEALTLQLKAQIKVNDEQPEPEILYEEDMQDLWMAAERCHAIEDATEEDADLRSVFSIPAINRIFDLNLPKDSKTKRRRLVCPQNCCATAECSKNQVMAPPSRRGDGAYNPKKRGEHQLYRGRDNRIFVVKDTIPEEVGANVQKFFDSFIEDLKSERAEARSTFEGIRARDASRINEDEPRFWTVDQVQAWLKLEKNAKAGLTFFAADFEDKLYDGEDLCSLSKMTAMQQGAEIMRISTLRLSSDPEAQALVAAVKTLFKRKRRRLVSNSRSSDNCEACASPGKIHRVLKHRLNCLEQEGRSI